MAISVDGRALYPLGEALAATDFPLVSMLPADAFDGIYYLSADAAFDDTALVVAFELAFEGELALTPPGTDAIALVLGSAGVGWTGVRATVTIGAEPSILLEEVTLGLRLRGDILRDVATGDPASITITADLRVSADGFTLERFEGASLAPAYVADTDIVVEAHDVRPVFGGIDPPGWLSDRPDFHGLAIDVLSVTLPNEYLHSDPGAELRLELSEAAIDADGFTGRLSASSDAQHPVTGTLFGFRYRFRTFELDIHRNTARTARFGVDLRLTPLEQAGEEKWVAVDVGFAAGRRLSGALSAAQPPGASDDPRDLVSVELADVARLGLRALRIEVADGVVRFLFSGVVSVRFGEPAIIWPTVEFDEFGIGSDGSLIMPAGGVRVRDTLVARLGPVTLGAGRFGLAVGADGALVFVPPTEIVVAIDAPAVSGGGFLFFDPVKQQYAGGLRLQFEKITLNAVGLLTTRLPDGSPGVSLLVIVQASGFTPIQLGFGFSLNGVGGLLGINRTVAVDVLRAGVRNRTLDAILFSPDDPTPRAPQIVTALQSVFPPAGGQHVFGPMAQIGWGAPVTLVTIELALILELPSPVRLIVLGRIRAALPDPDHPIVAINLDVVGVVDFDRGELSVDATLYDSMVGPFALTGDMAARANWGTNPDFAMALGGFHPAYTPPPGFPALRRLTLALSTGQNPRLRMETYFALTSNTVQVGARLELAVEVGGFSLEGNLGFDTLIQFTPFRLLAEIYAQLALKRGATTLMGLNIHVHLTGPSPWVIWGEATFKIFFVSFSLPFRAQFGRTQDVPAIARQQVWPILRDSLTADANWSAQLPPQGGRLVVLRDGAGDGELTAHPLGTLTVSQQLVPLQRTLGLFGSVPPKDHDRFAIVAADGLDIVGVATEYFAPAQFRQMSDAEKLASPAYERMISGVHLAPDTAIAVGYVQDMPLDYEQSVILDVDQPSAERLDERYAPGDGEVAALAQHGPAGTAPSREQGRAKFAPPVPGPAVADPTYVVVDRDTLTPVPLDGLDGSYTAAAECVRGRTDRDELQIVRAEELELA
ncbi:DUF6603 domain-containing protein [Micromonospora sp. NPDC052213]|uniref:DUF6603 domain-containing protein n=1 Tax=Micromonospora sp. NPDC052213 TaxID=3155812 RepID=UPI00342DB09F